MVRIVKKHEDRRNEILNTAQMLFLKDGYDSTSISNIIKAVDIAKGTFYHYFNSKEELLDEIIENMVVNIDMIILKMISEFEGNALEKMNTMFVEIGQYKALEKDVLIMMTRALWNEKNIILRSKLSEKRFKKVIPQLAEIIKQGKDEGIFDTGDPIIVTNLILYMGVPFSEFFASLVLENKLDKEHKDEYLAFAYQYNRAIERILGAPKDSVQIFDMETIDRFFD